MPTSQVNIASRLRAIASTGGAAEEGEVTLDAVYQVLLDIAHFLAQQPASSSSGGAAANVNVGPGPTGALTKTDFDAYTQGNPPTANIAGKSRISTGTYDITTLNAAVNDLLARFDEDVGVVSAGDYPAVTSVSKILDGFNAIVATPSEVLSNTKGTIYKQVGDIGTGIGTKSDGESDQTVFGYLKKLDTATSSQGGGVISSLVGVLTAVDGSLSDRTRRGWVFADEEAPTAGDDGWLFEKPNTILDGMLNAIETFKINWYTLFGDVVRMNALHLAGKALDLNLTAPTLKVGSLLSYWWVIRIPGTAGDPAVGGQQVFFNLYTPPTANSSTWYSRRYTLLPQLTQFDAGTTYLLWAGNASNSSSDPPSVSLWQSVLPTGVSTSDVVTVRMGVQFGTNTSSSVIIPGAGSTQVYLVNDTNGGNGPQNAQEALNEDILFGSLSTNSTAPDGLALEALGTGVELVGTSSTLQLTPGGP